MSARWGTARLRDLTRKVGSGSTPRGGAVAYVNEGTPFVRSLNVHFDGLRKDGLVFLTDDQARALEGVKIHVDDVLLNITGASIGRVALAPTWAEGARVNQHVCIIRLNERLEPAFLAAYLRAPQQQILIMQEEAGATRQALTKEKILDFEVPVPSLDEQRRIVAKLEALQARSRRAKEALDTVPALLEKLRQSILAAAFRGDLTKDWRAQNPNVEPASELLKRIRAERRAKWEEAELAKLKAKGKTPSDDKWKAKYKEPEPVDPTGLPELPAGWCWASVDEITLNFDGDRIPLKQADRAMRGGSYPYYGASGIIDDIDDFLFDGDFLLIAEDGANLLSRNSPIAFSASGRFWVNNHAHVVREVGVARGHLREFLNGTSLAPWVTGTAQPKLTQKSLNRIPVPVCARAESEHLVALVSARLLAVTELETRLLSNDANLAKLTDAIMAKAFRGDLVPQDRNELPH